MAVCILLVEDEWITLTALASAFEGAGYPITIAEHGRHALAHLENHTGRFTGLVTDLHIRGGVTGMHLVERMRPAYPTIPMVLTTAVVHAIPPKWQTQRAVHLHAKPYEPEMMVALMSRLLSAAERV